MAQHEKITSKAARDHTDVYHNRMWNKKVKESKYDLKKTLFVAFVYA
jgi:hypothetical protein